MDEIIRENIDKCIDNNIDYIKKILKDNSDIVMRDFYVGNMKFFLLYVDGMGDKELINHYIMEPIMRYKGNKINLNIIKDRIINISEVSEKKSLKDGINGVLSGDTFLLIDNETSGILIGTRKWPTRGITEPSSETVIKGSREGFSETIRFNTALIRRRVRDTRLKIEYLSIGRRSKTDVNIIYIEDIVNKEALNILKDRIALIDIDAIFDSGILEEFIEDNIYSPFPQVQYTERPDVVAAALYEGRTALLIDNSPSALIIPATLPNLFQTPDDYNGRWINGSFVRLIRLISIIFTLIMPGLYISVTSFNTSIIPTKLAYSIASSREGVPFPAYLEVVIMEFFLALLLEAIIRLPKPIGSTIGIVGGLIIGQAAVSAGIVSPIMIIILSVTAISSFITPNYDVTSAFRIYRYLLIGLSSIIGLYGLIIGFIISLISLLQLKSFGISYLSPGINPNINDFKDFIIRVPYVFIRKRPSYMKTGDKIRQKKR